MEIARAVKETEERPSPKRDLARILVDSMRAGATDCVPSTPFLQFNSDEETKGRIIGKDGATLGYRKSFGCDVSMDDARMK